MRRVRYAVASSADGYIAGPDGGADWIVHNPEIDFGAIFAQFDTLLVGRKTFEPMVRAGRGSVPGMSVVVFSRTLRPQDYPRVRVVNEDAARVVKKLRAEPGKDIWLFGGGELFRTLLEASLVDTVELAVMPVLLGGGIPLLAPPCRRAGLRLTNQRVVQKSGIVMLEYAVKRNRRSGPATARSA